MPTKDHKRKGIEETLLRVLFRGLPKDDEIHRILGILTQAADSFEKNEFAHRKMSILFVNPTCP